MKKIVLAIAVGCTFSSAAQEITSNGDTLDIDDLYMDFAIPNVAASSLLEIEPTSISKPGSVKKFFIGLSNFVDLEGNIKPNLSLEWAPLKTFIKNSSRWKASESGFNWKSFAFSLATASDSSNARLAGAFKWALIDRTNALLDFNGRNRIKELIENQQGAVYLKREKINTLEEDYEKLLLSEGAFEEEEAMLFSSAIDIYENTFIENLTMAIDSTNWKLNCLDDCDKIKQALRDSVNATFKKNGKELNVDAQKLDEIYSMAARIYILKRDVSKETKENFSKNIISLKETFKKENWNKLTLEVGFGGILNSPEATIQTMRHQYQTGYISTAFCPFSKFNWSKGFGLYLKKHSQIIGLVKYTNYTTQDSIQDNLFFAGTRFLIGEYDKRFSAEVAYINNHNLVTGLNNSGIRYSMGAEFRLSDGNWLEFAIGGESFSGSSRVNLLPKLAFRHAFNSENRFFKK